MGTFQKINHRLLPLGEREIERALLIVGTHADIGAGFDEHARELDISALGR